MVSAAFFMGNLSFAMANPVVLSKKGQEMIYIKSIDQGAGDMPDDQMGVPKRFDTYNELQSAVHFNTGKVWIGSIITKDDDICTESTVALDGKQVPPGEPKLKTTYKPIQCPS